MTANNDAFTFSHTSEDRSKVKMTLEAPDSGFQPWTEVLDRFVDFLETVYGYNIKDQIRVRYSPVLDVCEYWRGGVFEDDPTPDEEDFVEFDDDDKYDEYDNENFNPGLTE
jgi:hypothetical protein